MDRDKVNEAVGKRGEVMAHDWGVKVPANLPSEALFEILGKLRDGKFDPHFDPSLASHPRAEEWRQEITEQMLAAYEAEASRRRS